MNAEKRISRLAQIACILEACAPKPGNVNRSHDFPDTTLEDFLISAIAIGPALENAGPMGVGHTVLQAVADTRRSVRSNTNLGMVLLLVPLVKACMASADCVQDLRQNLGAVLDSLTVEDARLAYAAIRLAQPAGLGHVPQADIAEEPSVTLLQAMSLARERDAVAREYVTGYSITFEIGLPALKEASSRGAGFSAAIVQAFLTVLSRVPDTLIARKKGIEEARRVSLWAGEVLARGGIFTPGGRAELAEMDRGLRDPAHELNPGTAADLTAAAIFLALFEGRVSG
jgi:triphosphoribosyl-dephospho-CoA synthase